jgi:hypothetical protein
LKKKARNNGLGGGRCENNWYRSTYGPCHKCCYKAYCCPENLVTNYTATASQIEAWQKEEGDCQHDDQGEPFLFKTACELFNEVFGWSKISVRRIQEILKDKLGISSRVAAKKLMLTKKMVKKRLPFCKQFCHWKKKQ